MKATFHKMISVLMAVLLLASTMSWTVGKHYCMGRLMNVSFFEHADDCGMDMDGISFFDELESCCNDEMLVIDGQDDLKMSFSDLSFDQQLFVASFIYSYINLFESFDEQIDSFKDHSPPPLIRDILVLDQTFLI